MSTCNRVDLQTLGSQPIMPKNLPDHCLRAELTCVYSEDCDSVNQSDSQRFCACLSDLDSDVNKAYDPLKSKEEEVHVFKEIQPYQDCVQLMAEVLENCKGILL